MIARGRDARRKMCHCHMAVNFLLMDLWTVVCGTYDVYHML